MNIIRWIILIPASILAMLLISFVAHWIALGTMPENSAPEDLIYFERIAQSFLAPIAMISTSAYIAPKSKFYTAITVAILYLILYGGTLFYVFNQGVDSDSALTTTIKIVLGIIGSVIAVSLAKSNYGEV